MMLTCKGVTAWSLSCHLRDELSLSMRLMICCWGWMNLVNSRLQRPLVIPAFDFDPGIQVTVECGKTTRLISEVSETLPLARLAKQRIEWGITSSDRSFPVSAISQTEIKDAFSSDEGRAWVKWEHILTARLFSCIAHTPRKIAANRIYDDGDCQTVKLRPSELQSLSGRIKRLWTLRVGLDLWKHMSTVST